MPRPADDDAPRGPGRPPADRAPDSRQALLDAAHDLFAEHAFDAVSTKRIADAAGVNPAMIQYHFGGKSGLLETAFRETLAPIVDALGALGAGDEGAVELEHVIGIYMRTMLANPWLPKFLVRHVLPENGPLQPLLVARLRHDVAPALRRIIERAQARGELRGDLDPVMTTLSLVGLALFPYLSLPVSRRALGFDVDADSVDALVAHTADVFRRGTGSA